MKTFIEVLKVIGAGLGFLLLVCLPGFIEWICKPLPTWLLFVIVIALSLGAGIIAVWNTFFKGE